MPPKPSPVPTEAELELLRIVWELGEATVHEVRGALPPERDPAYTTVMTTMVTLARKGYLTRIKRGASYVYRPRVDEEEVTRGMIRQLLGRMFDGSAERLLVKLIRTGGLSKKQLARLRREIDEANRREGAKHGDSAAS
jgi:BlaI family penicillinase repressor